MTSKTVFWTRLSRTSRSDAENYAGRGANAFGYLGKAGGQRNCPATGNMLTHCAPTSIAQKIDQHNEADQLTDFLESVKNRCQFAYWFLGHYHRNQIIDQKYILQWEQISKIG